MTSTQGLTGTAATTYRTNFTAGNFAQAGEGSYIGSSGTRPTKGSLYTVTLYKSGVLYKTITTTLTADLVDAAQAINLAWNDLGPQSLAALDPTNVTLNGALASIPIDWIQNTSAESISRIWVSLASGAYDNYTPFTIGATSVVATPAPGTTVTNLIGAPSYNGPYTGYREIGQVYLTKDGTFKYAAYTYN
jgi:hypothetical protein